MLHRLWLFALLLLVPTLATLLAADEPAKGKVKGTTIVPDAVAVKPGGPLSTRTPVARPPTIKGVRSWTIETRRHRWTPNDVAVSPDGSLVATSGLDGMIHLWDAETGKLVRVLVGHDSFVYGIAFSPDGRYLASTGAYDLTVRVWDAGTGLPLKVLKGLKEAPISVAWSPDGSLLAAGTVDSGYVAIWKMGAGTLVKTVSNGKTVLALAFSPDGKTLASWISTIGVNFRTTPTWAVDSQIDFMGQSSRVLSYADDGKHMVTGGGKQTVVWDTATKKVVRRYDWAAYTLGRHVNRLAVNIGAVWNLETHAVEASFPKGEVTTWSADGKAIYVLSGNDVIRVNPSSGAVVRRWSVAEGGTLWWFPGRPIVTGIGTTNPRLWDPATGKLLHTLAGHTAATTVLAFSPSGGPADGKMLATGAKDKTVCVWNPATGKLLRSLEGFEGEVTALAVSSDGKIAAASADQKLRIFPALATKASRTYSGNTDGVKALAWSKDGKLASAGQAAAVHLWSLDAAKPTHSLEHAGSIESLAFSPNGKFLAAGAAVHRVTVWAYPSRKLVKEFTQDGSPPAVTALAWSADSSQLIDGRNNHTLQLWDLKQAKARMGVNVLAPAESVSWAAAGKMVVSCTLDRSVRFWSPVNGQIQTTVVADIEQLSCIAGEGNYRAANEAESELVCVALTEKGMDVYAPKEFAAKFGWKNNPAKARIPGN